MAVPQANDNLYITGLPEGFEDTQLRTILGAYGNIVRCKCMNMPGKKATAMVQYSSIQEAQWIVENLDGNIPQGLTEPVGVKYAFAQGAKGMDKGAGKGMDGSYANGAAPYPAGKGGGDKGKGKGKCSIKTLVKGLADAGALPGGQKYANDENTLFVGGLPQDTTDTDMYKIFAPFGAIAPMGVKAMADKETGLCKGFGFVNFLETSASQTAITTLNGTQMPDGTFLKVMIKKEDGPGGKGKDGGKDGGKGFGDMGKGFGDGGKGFGDNGGGYGKGGYDQGGWDQGGKGWDQGSKGGW